MKRRVNILCVVVMLLLSYSVLEMGYYFVSGVVAGVGFSVDNREEIQQGREIPSMKVLELLPDYYSMGSNLDFKDSIYNEKTGCYIPMTYSSVVVNCRTQHSLPVSIMSALASLLSAGLCVWAVLLFFRLVMAINRSEIFCWKNVRYLRRLGFSLLVAGCCSMLVAYIDYRSLVELYSFSGYSLHFSGMVLKTSPLVLGLCALIVGEVFAIGLKMKEEQDLTI